MPDYSYKAFKETRKYEENGLHRKLYTLSQEDYQEAGLVFNGPHPEDGKPLGVVFGAPEGVPAPDLEEELQLNSPGADDFDPEMFKDLAKEWASSCKYQLMVGNDRMVVNPPIFIINQKN